MPAYKAAMTCTEKYWSLQLFSVAAGNGSATGKIFFLHKINRTVPKWRWNQSTYRRTTIVIWLHKRVVGDAADSPNPNRNFYIKVKGIVSWPANDQGSVSQPDSYMQEYPHVAPLLKCSRRVSACPSFLMDPTQLVDSSSGILDSTQMFRLILKLMNVDSRHDNAGSHIWKSSKFWSCSSIIYHLIAQIIC